MIRTDRNGRPYAKLSDLAEGDIVQVDEGFDCIPSWQIRRVFYNNGFCVKCEQGDHSLAGQLSYTDKDTLIGVYKLVGEI